MSALAAQWLSETFIYTGLLIALVLALRRPVARYFGPGIAYALWALPGLRFIMPPILLPASMAPAAEAAPVVGGALPMEFGLIDVLVPVWLLGALAFLAWRAGGYLLMRRDILQGARPAGESGDVRLVETAGVAAPVAFGILDKVIALPPGFMAQYDRSARDLAIAHELAHHRGHDLLINILAQPVLALHWFNPLAWRGWQALRKDQEAACDARVMAGRERAERAAYAQVIAGFAAGDRLAGRLALAAPMACPVLGEKSIIHRLRSLSMAEVSQRRQRIGITLLAAGALAVPATASVGYMQQEVRAVPVSPAEPQKREVSREIAIAPPAVMQEPQAPAPPSASFVVQAIEPDVPQPAADAPAVLEAAPVAVQMPTTPVAFAPQNHVQMEVRCAGSDGAILCETTQVLVSLHPVDNAPHLIRASAIQIRRYSVTAPVHAADPQDEPSIGKTV